MGNKMALNRNHRNNKLTGQSYRKKSGLSVYIGEFEMEEAIQFVMNFYDQPREVILELYMDEVEAYMRLMEKFNAETN